MDNLIHTVNPNGSLHSTAEEMQQDLRTYLFIYLFIGWLIDWLIDFFLFIEGFLPRQPHRVPYGLWYKKTKKHVRTHARTHARMSPYWCVSFGLSAVVRTAALKQIQNKKDEPFKRFQGQGQGHRNEHESVCHA